ncbi:MULTISPECIES: hypothetical protein [Gardnerella]|uniref:ATPase n=2 Tax=Gardnerella TaxID=2701 RepID=A0ABX4SG78_9BIFI|nr:MULTISPECIES: hypothetical protein [Gardnerella]EIK85632.1 hypothetical protein CGSMWGv00703C2mash_03654 [Gardnerella pickettii 00703C2mash]PKZ52974.1 hypothetical protein CYJ70_04470 [Gardnerella pickettii]RFD77711.1 hypothetical protein AXE73_03755 [Gardnerella vaginalis]
MKNFFKGISFTQVLAGSLAAVTAFLLSSKIGIAGSVIGVAIGSIVSAVASQLYQNVIHASSKKIQSSSALKSGSSRYEEDDTKVVNNARFIALEDDMPKEYEVYNNMIDSSKEKQARRVVAMASNANNANFAGDSSLDGDSSNSQNAKLGKAPALSAESTSVMELSSLRKLKEEDNALSEGDEDSILTLNDAKRELGGRSDYANSEAKYKKLTIVIAILSALAAVLLTAGIVLLFTQGKGTDNLVPSGQNTEQNNGQNPNNQMRQNGQNNGVQNQDKNSKDVQKDSQDAQDEKDSKDSKDSKDGENSSSKNPSEKQDKKTHERSSSSSLDSNGSKADSGDQSSEDSGVSGADSGARGSKGDSSVSGDSSPSSPSTSTNRVSGGSASQQGESGSQQSGS